MSDSSHEDNGSKALPPEEPKRTQQETPTDDGPTSVLVRFRVPGEIEECDAADLDLKPHDLVVLDGERGTEIGCVIQGPHPCQRSRRLPKVLRPLNAEDRRLLERARVREREAFQFCDERIKARNLSMKLVAVDLAHSRTRAVFYFSSNERVDFRSLVKDLARRFHTRIEMKQIGVRDAARHTGGIALCGRELCCATWLPAFSPISIRMAKDQNLALNHQKLSGLCGRLRCCLQYEQETYHTSRKGLPKIGKRVVTPTGEGRVKDVDVLRRRVRVLLQEGGYEQFEADQVTRPADPTPQKANETPPSPDDRTQQPKTTKRRRRKRRGRRGKGQESAGSGPGPERNPSAAAETGPDKRKDDSSSS